MGAGPGRWADLVGARIRSVEGSAGRTTIVLSGSPTDGADRTVVVQGTRGVSSSLRDSPSSAVERVTPVFIDGSVMIRLETESGEELTVTGGGAWLD